MADRIQLRRDTKANWESYNPILLEGEPGHVLDYPNLYKMGDGIHAWNDLPYRGYNGTVTQDIRNEQDSVPSNAAVYAAFNSLRSSGYLYVGIATTETNPGTPTEKVFYIAKSAGTYTNFGSLILTQGINILKFNGTAWSVEQVYGVDDNPIENSDNLVKSSGVDAVIKSSVGYYICDTASDIAAKTIAATHYVLREGGSIKVKFTNINTAANPTLNINDEGAKPLFYCGKIAGDGNSWKAGEVVEIYYDGTNYQASNVIDKVNIDSVLVINEMEIKSLAKMPIEIESSPLPEGYTLLESIRNPNGAYINTGVFGGSNIKVEARFRTPSNVSPNTALFGSDNNPYNNNGFSLFHENNAFDACIGSDGKIGICTILPDTDYDILMNEEQGLYINNVLITNFSYSEFSNNEPLYIFGLNRNGSLLVPFLGSCYYFNIYENEELIKSFMPCIDINNVIGMYDIINGIFYQSGNNKGFVIN